MWLTPEGCAGRRRRLWAALPAPVDRILLSDPNSLIYFAGYAPNPFQFQFWNSRAFLLLDPDRATLLVDNRSATYVEPGYVDDVVTALFYEGKASAPHRERLMHDLAKERSGQPGHIGVEAATLPAGLVDEAKTIDLDPIIRDLRRAKDPDELAALGQSLRAIEAGMDAALTRAEPGMTEWDIHRLVQQSALDVLGEPAIVYGDFASNPAGRVDRKGGPPSRRVIGAGDAFILDFSVVVHGYRGDVANTFVVGGRPSDRLSELAQACFDALAAGEALLKPGVAGREVDAAVRDVMAQRGLGANFSSHVGHGLGLNHLEPPFVVPQSVDVLCEGDVLTLEPGQYLDGVGGMRFEHNYRITAQGFEQLSRHRLSLS